jgi:selenocysteine lyase/cysteine desulfurase
VFPWYGVARKFGVEVRNVPQDRGSIPVERILGSLDAATRAVTVSTISFAPGFRFPVAELGAECRKRGVLLVVDAAQSTGIMATDVKAWQVDALAASTQKGLMALYGLGFLYVRSDLAETLDPVYLSRFGVDLADAHEASAGDPGACRLAAGARRFDVGNYNYAAAIAVGQSIRFLLEIGPDEVEAYVFGLAREFARRIGDLGLPVYAGPSAGSGSHIVTVGRSLGLDHDSSADRDMSDLYGYLSAHGVRLGVRRDLLRFSFHLYNNEADIDRVAALCRDWIGARSASAAAARA